MRPFLLIAMLVGPALLTGCAPAQPEAQQLYQDTVTLWTETGGEGRRSLLEIAGIEGHRPCARAASPARELSSALCADWSLEPGQGLRWREHARHLDRAIEQQPSAAALHGRALARLALVIEARDLALAQADLEQALTLASDSAAIRNDLGVVMHLRAGLEERPEPLMQAAEMILEAHSLDPRPIALRANAAHLLSELHLTTAAESAWRAIAAEARTGWAEESAAALDRLLQTSTCDPQIANLQRCLGEDCPTPSLSSLCLEEAARWLQDEMLPNWARSALAGEAASAGVLERAARQVEAIWGQQDHHGGEAFARLVTEIDALRSPSEQLALATALRDYSEGLEDLFATRYDAADARFEQAWQRTPAESVLRHLLRYERVRLAYLRQSEIAETSRLFQELALELRDLPWWRLRGNVARFQGLLAGALGFEDRCRRFYQEAIELYARSGSLLSRGRIRASLLESDFYIGNHASGWRRWQEGLAHPSARLRPRVAYNLLDAAAVAMAREGDLPRLREVVTEELVALGERVGTHNYVYQALMRHAASLSRTGRTRSALRSLDKARERAGALADPSHRARAIADLDLTEAEVLRQTDPQRAIQLLGDSLGKYRREGHVYFDVQILKARADARISLQEVTGAEADLEEAARLIERALAELGEREPRMHYLDLWRKIFDLRVSLALAEDPAVSLAKAEQGRLRNFVRDVEPTTLASLTGPLPGLERACVLVYRSLPDELLIWSRFGEGWQLQRIPVPSSRLRRVASELHTALEHGNQETVDHLARQAHAWLIEPARACMRGGESLALVPDGFLYTLPYAALPSATGELLIEEVAYQLLPGLGVGVPDRPVAADRAGQALLLASPRPPQASYPELAHLAHAKSEIERVAALLPLASRLDSADLRREEFLRVLASARVFHFAGHAVDDFQVPLNSALLIGDADRAVVTAADLLAQGFPSLELVFLSACRAMAGPASGSAGALSLARAFLDAGARAVVGSVTQVDDAATAELAVAFHRQLAAGLTSPQALRSAQLERRRAGDPLATWAGYSVLGSLALD